MKYRSASQKLTECVEARSFLCERSKVQSSHDSSDISSRAPCLKINIFLFNSRLSCGCFPNAGVYIITVRGGLWLKNVSFR